MLPELVAFIFLVALAALLVMSAFDWLRRSLGRAGSFDRAGRRAPILLRPKPYKDLSQ